MILTFEYSTYIWYTVVKLRAINLMSKVELYHRSWCLWIINITHTYCIINFIHKHLLFFSFLTLLLTVILIEIIKSHYYIFDGNTSRHSSISFLQERKITYNTPNLEQWTISLYCYTTVQYNYTIYIITMCRWQMSNSQKIFAISRHHY